MPFRLLRISVIAAGIAGLVASGILGDRAEAQKEGAPLWYSVVKVNRVKKPDRQSPHHTIQRAALLTLQWHLLQRGDGNTQNQVNARKKFEADDQVKLAVTV